MKNKAADMGALLAGKLRAKSDFRRQQAKLPFERKLEIVIQMQKLAADIGKITGRKPVGTIWRWQTRKYQNGKVRKTRTSKLAVRN